MNKKITKIFLFSGIILAFLLGADFVFALEINYPHVNIAGIQRRSVRINYENERRENIDRVS